MEKFYYENSYIRDFTAEIIDVIEKDNKYHVELDKTYFYPGNQSQPNDIGSINSSSVIYVYEEKGKIYHVIETKPLKIHKVKCSINWKRRYDYMQQSLGAHIISGCFLKLLNANTVDFKLGEDISYIDIEKIFGMDESKKVEDMANRIIFDNIAVETIYPTKSELKKLFHKNLSKKAGEQVRVIKIEDVQVRPCDGIYPRSTVEVQIIKITKVEKRGNATRIYFICGSRAASDYLLKYECIERMSNILSCSKDNLLGEVERLEGELNKALSERAVLKAEILQYEVQEILNNCHIIQNVKVIKSIYDNGDLKQINSLALKLVAFPNVIVLFGVKSGDKAQLIFIRSKDLNLINMNNLLKDAITLIDGKGGGSEFSAQGGGKNNNNLDSAIEYAYNKVKESIELSC